MKYDLEPSLQTFFVVAEIYGQFTEKQWDRNKGLKVPFILAIIPFLGVSVFAKYTECGGQICASHLSHDCAKLEG